MLSLAMDEKGISPFICIFCSTFSILTKFALYIVILVCVVQRYPTALK